MLLDNYCAGHEFRDRALVVDPAGEIGPHRTVYAGDDFALRIAPTDDREAFDLRTVDHGQVVGKGDRPVETARNGVLRSGSH